MRRRNVSASTLLVASFVLVGFAPSTADAHWSASYSRRILVERYLVCDDEGELDAQCVGPVLAEPGLLAALEPAALVVDRNNDHLVDPARDAAVFAAYFDMQQAVVPLRRLLTLPMPPGADGTHTEMEVKALRAEAAYALAKLGDSTSTGEIASLVREFETEGYGTLWEDTLGALTELSPDDAAAYSRDFLGRIELSDLRMSMPGGSSQLVALQPIVIANDRDAIEVLRRLTKGDNATKTGRSGVDIADSHGWCQMTATRLMLGEQPLVDDVRKAFAGSYSGTHVATCDTAFIKAYGSDPADAGILLRHLGRDDLGFDASMANASYGRMIELVATLGTMTGKTAERARRELRKGLDERSLYPHVAEPGHRNFAPHFVAFHTAALAGLGDEEARLRLSTIIRSPDDRSGVGDLAAVAALRLGLPTAVDDAAERLALDVGFGNDERSGIFEDVRARLFAALVVAAPTDPRWAVALVDGESDVRERAMAEYARRPIPGACDAVTAAAHAATDRGIDDGFLVLTTRGDGCRPQFERLAADAHAPADARGMAFEALAILGARVAPDVLRRAKSVPDLRVHLERATLIAEAISSARPSAQPKAQPSTRASVQTSAQPSARTPTRAAGRSESRRSRRPSRAQRRAMR